MKQRDLKNTIISSYNNATPDCLEQIKKACEGIEQVDYDVYLNENKKISRFTVSRFVALAACFFAVIIAGFSMRGMLSHKTEVEETNLVWQEPSVEDEKLEKQEASQHIENSVISLISEQAAVIYLDVNPSIEVKVDNELKVLDCIAVNEDAKIVLKDKDLKDKKFKVAFNVIVSSLNEHGYLKGDTDAILVSVDTKADGMLEKVDHEVSVVLKDNSVECDLISQAIVKDEKIEKLAKEYHVSEGKIVFVDKIISSSIEYSEESIDELVKYPVKYLNSLYETIKNKNVDNSQTQTKESNPKENETKENATGSNPVNEIVDDSLNFAGDVVEDSLNFAGDVVEDSLNFAGDVADDSLNFAGDVVDNAFDTAQDVVGEVLGKDNPVENILEDTQNIVDDSIDTIGNVIGSLLKP